MASEETSAQILERFKDGDSRAADELFARYVARLTLLARSRLSPALASRTDPEDVVLSAYRSFFIRARDGQFQLEQSGDLWRLLVAITLHKLYRHARKHRAERRALNARGFEASLANRVQRLQEPSPEEAIALADELQALFAKLNGFERRVLELRLQDQTLEEIAAEVGRSERTVRRTLAAIRQRLLDQNADTRAPIGKIARAFQPKVGAACGRSKRPKTLAQRLPTVPDSLAPLAYSDYLLQEMIGAGRFGRVYRAWQRGLGRTVAIKYLRKSFQEDPEAVARFIDEARTVSMLKHPGIVSVHGIGKTPGGGYFLAMDLVEGPDLARRVGRGPIAVADAMRWMIEAAEALGHAHERGIVHCDLKPANLLLDEHSRVHVTDFGLSRSLRAQAQAVDRIEGTCGFMAPEQTSARWGPVSPRTDVYGIGAVLFNLLTGEPPYCGATVADILSQVVSTARVRAPIELRPDMPESVNEICLRCLAKSPNERYADVERIAVALRESLTSPETGASEQPY